MSMFADAREAGLDIDDTECETSIGIVSAPPELGLPINGHAVLSVAGDGLFGGIIILQDDTCVGTLAIGHSEVGAYHVRLTADEARSVATAMLRLAAKLGGGLQ